MDRTTFRDHVRTYLLERARNDAGVVGAAVVGSLATGPGDHWSDLDLTFAVTDKPTMASLLDEWTRDLVRRFDAAPVLDLWRGETVYRVFFLPECVQLDLSFTPSSTIPMTSERVKVLFGEPQHVDVGAPRSMELFGWTLMWAWSARVSIERNKLWMAEYCIAGARNSALEMACVRLGLPAQYGKGFDQLPPEAVTDFMSALTTCLDTSELRRALRAVVAAAGREADRHEEISAVARARLDEVLSAS